MSETTGPETHIFERISLDSVAEAVVAQIESLIIAGVLKAGQKLPSERELSETMDVSRPKIRDAIKILESRGLLSVRHGDGTFVADLTSNAISPAMVDLISRHPSAFGDYLEFRREVEGFAAYAAAERATAEDCEIIGTLLDDMIDAHKKADPDEEARIDVRFHTAIVDATHNSMLVHVMASIYELMQRGVFYNRNYLYRLADSRDALLAQHRAIGEAVLARDAEAAARAAEAHMDYVANSFRTGREEEQRISVSRKRLSLLNRTRLTGTASRRQANGTGRSATE